MCIQSFGLKSEKKNFQEQFTSLLYTLAYMFRPHRAIIRASQITKECRLKCVSMNKILQFYKTNG
jgi:hypothetical protein